MSRSIEEVDQPGRWLSTAVEIRWTDEIPPKRLPAVDAGVGERDAAATPAWSMAAWPMPGLG